MLLIACPHCGNRPETEFRCGGQAHIARPAEPAAQSDEDWSRYLFVRRNPRGVHAERWCHAHGCGRWFNALRDTVSDRFIEIYPMGGQPRSAEAAEAAEARAPGTDATSGVNSDTRNEARA